LVLKQYDTLKSHHGKAHATAKEEALAAATQKSHTDKGATPDDLAKKANDLMISLSSRLATLLDVAQKVERYRSLPRVGTYNDLTKEKTGIKSKRPEFVPRVTFEDYTPHHTPPVELMQWVSLQAEMLAAETRNLEKAADSNFRPDEIQPFKARAAEFDRVNHAADAIRKAAGPELSCILIHEDTHVSQKNEDKVHGGKNTQVAVLKMMKNANLPPILTKTGIPVTKFRADENISTVYDETRAAGAGDFSPKTNFSAAAKALREPSRPDAPNVSQAEQALPTASPAPSSERKQQLIKLTDQYYAENRQASRGVFLRVHKQSLFALKHALDASTKLDGDKTAQTQMQEDVRKLAESTWKDAINKFAWQEFMQFE
jgi:hypothetical protein